MLYLLQLVIHMRYGQVSVSKELEPITAADISSLWQQAKCSMFLCPCFTSCSTSSRAFLYGCSMEFRPEQKAHR